MLRLSRLTWAQLRQQGRHGLGYEKIARSMIRAIRAGIPETIPPDVDLIAFRFYAKAPMVGFTGSDGTFHVIWFDRDFTLYKHN
jgi:hypothetical protein